MRLFVISILLGFWAVANWESIPASFAQDPPAQVSDKALIRHAIEKVVVVLAQGLGAGVIVSPDGDILTNKHNVGEHPFVRIRFSNGIEALGEVVARDARSDLALVRVQMEESLPFMNIADDAALEQGDTVFLCGHPFGEGSVCMKGIVSKRWTVSTMLGSHYYGEWISDAPVFPGFSGGAAVNMQEDLVGLPHARFPGRLMPAGVSILIPPGLLKKAYRDFKLHRKFRWAHLGIQVQDMPRAVAKRHGVAPFQGVLVRAMLPEVRAGIALQAGDVLTHFGDIRIRRIDELRRVMPLRDPGDVVKVTALRDGKVITATVEFQEGFLASEDTHILETIEINEVFGFTFHFDDGRHALIIDAVEEHGSAKHSGLKPGARIVWHGSNRRPIATTHEGDLFVNVLRSLGDGDGIDVRIRLDDGKTAFTTMLYNPSHRLWL